MLSILSAAALAAQPATQRCEGTQWKRWAFHAANALDKGVTHVITNNGKAREANPLMTPIVGHKVSVLEAVGMAAVASVGYEIGFNALHKRGDCRNLKRMQTIGLVFQGGVAAANLRFIF